MSSFTAKLELEGEVFNILRCRYSFFRIRTLREISCERYSGEMLN
jgi:hypothetical protein